MALPFQDRQEAGRVLADRLAAGGHRHDDLVLALPRGGVPVAFEVARRLGLPLDVFVVRKLGLPGQEELAIGAIASGGVIVLNDELVRQTGITRQAIDRVAAAESTELERRERLYRGVDGGLSPRGKRVIVVDDGLATGASMRAAVTALREAGAAHITVAVPVAARETCEQLADDADELVCGETPEPFYAVGLWYRDFDQTTDAEVRDLLARARGLAHSGGPPR